MWTNLIKKLANVVWGFLMISIFMSTYSFDMQAQSLDVYYKSNKTYINALIDGLKPAFKEGKYGFVNLKGKYIIPPVFDEVEEFQHELSVVKYQGKWGLINIHGETIVEPIYKHKPHRYEFINGSNVLKCDIFGDPIGREKYAVLYLRHCTDVSSPQYLSDPKYHVIKARECIKSANSLFIVVGEAMQSIKSKGLYGESYWINPNGVLSRFDCISKPNEVGIFVTQINNQWGVCGGKNNNGVIFSGYEFCKSLTKGVVLYKNQGANEVYMYVYLNYKGDIDAEVGYFYPPTEKIEKKLTFVGSDYDFYLVLRNSDNKVIAEGVSYSNIGNAVYELTSQFYDNTLNASKKKSKMFIRSDGTLITDDIISLKQEGGFVKIGVQHECVMKGCPFEGFGVLDHNGYELVPPVLSDKDVVIKGNSFLIHGKNCLNGKMVFASSDGWYQEIEADDTANLKKTMLSFYKKFGSVDVVPLKFAQNHKLVNAPFIYVCDGYFREETFNGVTYEQPLIGYFEGYKKSAYVISRKNKGGQHYLRLSNRSFKLDELGSKCAPDSSICNTFRLSQLASLSNGKILIKVEHDAYNVQSNLILLDLASSKVEKVISLSFEFAPWRNKDYDIYVLGNDFYLFNTSSLARYNNEGELLWEYQQNGDYLHGFDVNDSKVVITGFNTKEKYDSRPNPLIVLLNKESGLVEKRNVESYKINGEVNMFWPYVAFVDDGYVLQRNTSIKYEDDCFGDEYLATHKDIRRYDQSNYKFYTKLVEF